MKKSILALAIVAVSTVSFAADKLVSEEDKLSYAIGSDIGKNFKRQGISINADVLKQGMQDSLEGKPSAMTDQEMKETVQNFQKKIMMKRMADMQKQAELNKKEGEAFLAQNKSKPGVKTTQSGLQYKVLEQGTGASPKADDMVTVEYTGRLINGTVFDSTDKTGKPVKFNVGGVIKGWTEALQMMKPGGKWEVYIPSDLAYGSRQAGGPIGPNQTLIFEIKLLSVDKKDTKES